MGENFSIREFKLGFGSMNLMGVRFALEGSPYEVLVEELRLGFSLVGLLSDGPISEKTAEEITLYKPTLRIYHTSSDSTTENLELPLRLTPEARETYRSLIKEFHFVKRVTILEGEIEFIGENDSARVRAAKHINGWAYTNDKKRAWLRLAGHLFQTNEYNLLIYGQIDFAKGSLEHLNIDLHDYKLNNSDEFVASNYFDLRSGTLQGHLSVHENESDDRAFEIDGNISIKDANLKLHSENLFFENVNLSSEIKNWDISLAAGTMKINGSTAVLKGKITNIFDPTVELNLHSDKINIKRVFDKFSPGNQYPFSGSAIADISIDNRSGLFKAEGRLSSERVRFQDSPIDSLLIDFVYNQKKVTFSNFKASIDSHSIAGFGEIELDTPAKLIDFEFTMAGSPTLAIQKIGLSAAKKSFLQADLRLFGSLQNPVADGNLDLQIWGNEQPPLNMAGSLRYSRGELGAKLTANNEFLMNVSVDSVFENAVFDLEASNMQSILTFSNNPALDLIRRHFDLNLTATGSLDSVKIEMEGFRRSNYEKIFKLISVFSHDGQVKKVENRIRILPNDPEKVEGRFSLLLEEDQTSLYDLQIGDWLDGEIDFSNKSEISHSGKLNISGLNISTLFAMTGRQNERYDGKIFGELRLTGFAGAPVIKGNMWLHDGFINDMGPVKGELDFEVDKARVVVNKINFVDSDAYVDENDASTFLPDQTTAFRIYANGKYDFLSEEIDAAIVGSKVKIQDIVNLFVDEKDVIRGEGSVQVSLKGKGPNWPVYGKVMINDLEILMLKFDVAALDFGKQDASNGSYISKDYWNIGFAQLIKGDDFELSGSAALPFSGQPLDVALSGHGNFFSSLSDLADLFVDSDSEGALDLRMQGMYTKPNFSGSRWTFSHGELALNSVTEKVTDLNGDLTILEEDYLLNIKSFTGKIQGQPFSIANTTVDDTLALGGRRYESLRVAGDDLNLGVLFLKTPKKGLPINVPALMGPKETGWYRLDKYDNEESFLIAGPWQRPVVRGKVSVRNANIMFPFYDDGGEPNAVALNILDNINWDIYTVSDKDTRYAQRFQTGVYVDMEVDKESSRLDFKGILKDSTFGVAGKVESTRGSIEYFDLNFRVEKIGAEFNPGSLDPIVYGKAWTVVRDSTASVPSDVYLTLITVDDITNEENSRAGRWDRIQVKLSSEYPTYAQTQSDLMASLGYTSDTIDDQAKKAVGSSTDNFLFRPLIRPVERQLERRLSLDVVRFSYAIAQNFLDTSFNNRRFYSSLALLRSSRLILGKYLTDDLYFLYSGELKAGVDYEFQSRGIGLQHILGLEYRLNPRLLLQMEYDYNSLYDAQKDDKKIWLRHSFPF